MHRVLLAMLLLTGPLAGCVGLGGATVEEPDWPTGLVLTYEITSEGSTSEEVFLVHNGTSAGTQLLPWQVSDPGFSSPFVTFDEAHDPRDAGWSDLFSFPIEAGEEHTAQAGGANVTVAWSEVDHEGPLDAETDLEGVAETDDGEEVARFRWSTGEGNVLTRIEVDTPDGTNETWELMDTRLHADWNRPPSWSKGDWWTYNGTFRNEAGTSQIVYTTDGSTAQGEQYVLSPVDVENRVLMLPFQGWRQDDIAPQSGYVTGMLSSFWSWPLQHGKTWSGSTSAGEPGSQYQAVSRLTPGTQLPDGTVTTTFTIEAYAESQDDPFAVYEYAPRAEHLLAWRMGSAGADELDVNLTLEDWGEAFHGEMEIPRRIQVEAIPQGRSSFLSGPAEIDRTFDVPGQANTVQIAPRSFAVHPPDVDPSFEMQLTDPNGSVVVEHNASGFQDRRLDISTTVDAVEGSWRLTASIGEDVSVLARLYANWYEPETVDFRSEE